MALYLQNMDMSSICYTFQTLKRPGAMTLQVAHGMNVEVLSYHALTWLQRMNDTNQVLSVMAMGLNSKAHATMERFIT